MFSLVLIYFWLATHTPEWPATKYINKRVIIMTEWSVVSQDIISWDTTNDTQKTDPI
jgi:hypothetical protein